MHLYILTPHQPDYSRYSVLLNLETRFDDVIDLCFSANLIAASRLVTDDDTHTVLSYWSMRAALFLLTVRF